MDLIFPEKRIIHAIGIITFIRNGAMNIIHFMISTMVIKVGISTMDTLKSVASAL